MTLDLMYSQAEEELHQGNLKEGLKNLLEITKIANPREVIYEKAMAHLIGLYQGESHQIPPSLLNLDKLNKIFFPFYMTTQEDYPFPFATAMLEDIKNPPGMREHIKFTSKRGHYSHHLGKCNGEEAINFLELSERGYNYLVDLIDSYKYRMIPVLDDTLCCTFNNLGNTRVDKARFFLNNKPELMVKEAEKMGAELTSLEDTMFFVAKEHLKKAKSYYLHCMPSNPSYHENVPSTNKELELIRSDATENLEYVQKYIQDIRRISDFGL